MAKPRVFVSSTYYDLRHVRRNIELFVREMGYDPVLFENGDIPFKHDAPLDQSCYKEIETCHMQVLIVGGRYGSRSSDEPASATASDMEKMYEFYNSITAKEYETAIGRAIPVFVFVQKDVLAEYGTWKINRDNTSVKYSHVESTNIFRLIDRITAQRTGGYVKGFENHDDITSWLREQWAGLFADALAKHSAQQPLQSLSATLRDLESVTQALKSYSEAIIRKVAPGEATEIIDEQRRLLTQDKAQRLRSEPMLSYLADMYHLNADPLSALDALTSSSSLDEFLAKLGLADTPRVEFLERNRSVAERDYADFLVKYGTRGEPAGR